MHKPLVDTRWTRFKLLVRGLLFYNTVYWRRASDGLKPPKLTKEERRSLAPPKNLEVIKPRAKPRARLDEIRRQHMIDEISRLRSKMPAALARKLSGGPSVPDGPGSADTPPGLRRSGAGTTTPRPPVPVVAPAPTPSVPPPAPAAAAHRTVRPVLDTPIRRRRRRSSSPGKQQASAEGFLARLFGRKKA